MIEDNDPAAIDGGSWESTIGAIVVLPALLAGRHHEREKGARKGLLS